MFEVYKSLNILFTPTADSREYPRLETVGFEGLWARSRTVIQTGKTGGSGRLPKPLGALVEEEDEEDEEHIRKCKADQAKLNKRAAKKGRT